MQIPDYPDIVKNPMDFGTIKKKLNLYAYKSGQEFLDDMKLVFDNCIIYNGVSNNARVIMLNRRILKSEWLRVQFKRSLTTSWKFLILNII